MQIGDDGLSEVSRVQPDSSTPCITRVCLQFGGAASTAHCSPVLVAQAAQEESTEFIRRASAAPWTFAAMAVNSCPGPNMV